MPCTTILVGKKASFDGSTIVARNEDSSNGEFCPKRFVSVDPAGKTSYTSVISHLTVPLPQGGVRYTAMPNADLKEGLWEEAGFNARNVGMGATETLTTNERVLAADPLVRYDATTGTPGGIGEEDMVTLVLPYATSARDGVLRLGALLERYGTARAGVWKACLVSGVLFGAAHLSNLIGSAPFGVLMQCEFAASLGVMFAAIYFRTGNLWVTVFLHSAMDIAAMLIGGLYGTTSVAESVSGYDASRLMSVAVYLIPTVFLLRKKKLPEVQLYWGGIVKN